MKGDQIEPIYYYIIINHVDLYCMYEEAAKSAFYFTKLSILRYERKKKIKNIPKTTGIL